MLSPIFLAALFVLQGPSTHAEKSVVNDTAIGIRIVGLWRNYNLGRWEDLSFHNDDHFEWTLRYRMGGERVRGRFKIVKGNELELRIDEFQRIDSDLPTPKLDDDDPILFRLQLDHRGNLKLEGVGLHKRRPFSLTTYATRTYTSSQNFEKGVEGLLELLEEDEDEPGSSVGNDNRK